MVAKTFHSNYEKVTNVNNNYIKAKYLASQNKFEEALQIIDNISSQTDLGQLFLLKGKILANLQQFEQAESCLIKITENYLEWDEAQIALAKIRQLKGNKLKTWFLKNLKNKLVGIKTLLALFIICTAIFASMFFADRNDPQLKGDVKSIAQQSERISKNIILLNNIIDKNNLIRKTETQEIKKELIQENNKLNQQIDSIQLIQSVQYNTLLLLLKNNEDAATRIENMLKELKTLLDSNGLQDSTMYH